METLKSSGLSQFGPQGAWLAWKQKILYLTYLGKIQSSNKAISLDNPSIYSLHFKVASERESYQIGPNQFESPWVQTEQYLRIHSWNVWVMINPLSSLSFCNGRRGAWAYMPLHFVMGEKKYSHIRLTKPQENEPVLVLPNLHHRAAWSDSYRRPRWSDCVG